MRPANVLSVATAVPPHCFAQTDIAAAARGLFEGRYSDFDRLARVFESAGISRRFAVRPIEWYFTPLGWPERTAAYLDGAVELFIDAAGKALATAGLGAGEVDTVVTVSSTGIATPSLEARAAARLGFERVPVFGLGCAGGVSGLALAARLAQARPGSVVLMVAVELCTLAFRHDELTKANIVATALFGDGAAACVLRAPARGGDDAELSIEMSGQHTWPDTLDIMGWAVDPPGFGVIFDRAIPPFARANMAAAVGGILRRTGLGLEDVDRFAFHPGGVKVIEALEEAFALGQGALNLEREVLAEFGNMSAPTALFVLDRAMTAGLPARTLLTAMGPGFTASSVALKRAA